MDSEITFFMKTLDLHAMNRPVKENQAILFESLQSALQQVPGYFPEATLVWLVCTPERLEARITNHKGGLVVRGYTSTAGDYHLMLERQTSMLHQLAQTRLDGTQDMLGRAGVAGCFPAFLILLVLVLLKGILQLVLMFSRRGEKQQRLEQHVEHRILQVVQLYHQESFV